MVYQIILEIERIKLFNTAFLQLTFSQISQHPPPQLIEPFGLNAREKQQISRLQRFHLFQNASIDLKWLRRLRRV